MNPYSPQEFFELPDNRVSGLFDGLKNVWDAVAALPGYIETILVPEILGKLEEGAWIESGLVRIEKGSRIERGAVVRGPTIIGKDTVIRTGAYIRGHVIIGDGCVIGHGTEIRQTLVLNRTRVSHQNCVFTSLLGNRINLGGHTSTANKRMDGKEITIKIMEGDKTLRFPTGQTLMGAVIGDDTNVGGMTLFQPGAIIGKRCVIYPQCSVSGYIPKDSTMKSQSSSTV